MAMSSVSPSLDRNGSHRRFVGRFFGQLLENFEEDVVGVESFGLRFEVENDAVAQRGQVDAADVFEADVIAAFKEGPHFGGQSKGLGAAGTAAPAKILIGDWQRVRAFGMRGKDE